MYLPFKKIDQFLRNRERRALRQTSRDWEAAIEFHHFGEHSPIKKFVLKEGGGCLFNMVLKYLTFEDIINIVQASHLFGSD